MSGSATFVSGAPGVYNQEFDLAANQILPGVSTVVGIAYPAKKGPIDITTITSPDDYVDLYEVSNDWGSGPQSILQVLKIQPSYVRIKRVVSDDAKTASVAIVNNVNGSNATQSYIVPNTDGARVTTQIQQSQHINLIYSAAFVASNSIAVTISDGTTTATTASVVFATDSDTTLQLVANAINTLFVSTFNQTSKNPGSATVLKNSASATDDRIIFIIAPEGKILTITSTVTLGGSQATAVTSASPHVLNIYAENPGDWPNYKVGVKFSNFNFGVRQRTKLTFSAALVASNSIIVKLLVNGLRVNVGPVTYATDSDTTMAAIAAAIKTALGGQSDAFSIVVNSTNVDDREIVIVAPTDGPGIVSFIEATVTGGSSQAAITFSEILTGIDSDDTFLLEVFTNANVNIAKERFIVTLKSQISDLGNQQFIEDVINTSARKSKLIRVKYNTTNSSADILSNITSNIVWLNGGSIGSYPSDNKIAAGWNEFADPEKILVRLLMQAGYTSLTVEQKISSIAFDRKDCHAVLDVPSDLQDAQNAADYINQTLNVNHRWASIYTPDVLIGDIYSDRQIYIPPSAFAVNKIVNTDLNYAIYEAPAGLTRGIILNVLGLRKIYTKGDRGILEAARINPLRQFQNGSGIAIYGDNTLRNPASLTSAISVSRFFTFCQTAISLSLEGDVFDLFTPQKQFIIHQRISAFLTPYRRAGL